WAGHRSTRRRLAGRARAVSRLTQLDAPHPVAEALELRIDALRQVVASLCHAVHVAVTDEFEPTGLIEQLHEERGVCGAQPPQLQAFRLCHELQTKVLDPAGATGPQAVSYARAPAPARRLSAALLEPLAVSCLLGAIAAHGHAAPAPRMASRVIREEQRTCGSLAGLDVGEILRAHEAGQSFGDRDQQRLGRAPSALDLQLEGLAFLTSWHELTEGLVTLEQAIERLQLFQVVLFQGVAAMLLHEGPEPFTQVARALGDIIQLTR